MNRLHALVCTARSLLHRRRLECDLDAELAFHVEQATEQNVKRGMSPREARRIALATFGQADAVRDECRQAWGLAMLDACRQDIRYGMRALRRRPGFTAVVMLTLALGIGANTAIFSLTDQVLLRMLPVHQPEELVLLDHTPGPFQGRSQGNQVFSVPMFRGLRDASGPVLNGMFARFDTSATVSIGDEAERIFAELVSGDYFHTLGVGAVLGRTLGPDDDRTPDGHPVVVLSHGYWQRRFGGEARVLNQNIRVNGHPMIIVGVAAPGFSGVDPGEPVDVFVPLMMKRELTPTWNDLDSWRSRWVSVMGRLRPGVSRERAAAVLNVSYRQLLQEDVTTARLSSDAERARFLEKSLLVHGGARGRSGLRERFSMPLIVLMGMVGLVLLIACANVANLLLARATTQQKEVAIRLAIGAGRFRLVRQALIESLVLAAGGALVGLLFAQWTTGLLIQMLPSDRAARALSSSPDLRVVLFAIGVATLTALVFGLAPALHATTPALAPGLKADGGRAAGGGGQARVRKALVAVQVALSVLLLAGAGLFARTLYNLQSLNPGFATENLLQFSIDPALSGYSPDRSLVLLRTLEEQLNALPGVTSASLGVNAAMTNSRWRQTVKVQGYAPGENEDMSPTVNAVGPGYFATMGIPLITGREFRPSDDGGAARVAVINETMAKYFWEGQNPIGRRFGWVSSDTGDDIEVIGIVQDSKFTNIRDEIARFFYIPYTQAEEIDTVVFYVRHRPGIADTASAAREIVQRLDSNLPMFDMKTMELQVEESLFLERLVALLSILFGALATVLATVGLYGVMSYTVSCRTREIGIRVALGAARPSVVWIVLREVFLLAAAGISIGLPLALALGRLVESQLFGLSPTDPLTLGLAVTTLGIVALLAGYLPALRATRVNPVEALRAE